VAEDKPTGKKPRIRKSAPTVRENIEAAKQEQEASVEPGRIKKTAAKVTAPARKLRLRDRKVIKALAWVFRPVRRVLRWLVPSYLVNSWRELRKVVWPGRLETWRLTLAVFIFAIVFGALVAGVDKVLDEIFKKLVLK
jgi:preprotein translocase SecE subunit